MALIAAKKRVVVFGTGIIGGEAIRQFASEGYDVHANFNSRRFEWNGKVAPFEKRGCVDEMINHVEMLCRNEQPDLAVFALPSGGKNAAENELRLTRPFLDRTISMVLAGKAAFSEYPSELWPHLANLGVNAMVGGATRILEEMISNLRFDRGHPSTVDLEVNGTISFIMSNLWGGRPLDAVVRDAVDLKYAEPGINGRMPDPLDVFEGEVGPYGDVKKKLLIILNIVYKEFIGRFVKPDEIKVTPIDRDGMFRVTENNTRRKYIVRISTRPISRAFVECGSPAYIEARIADKVFIVGGFVNVPVGSALDTWVSKCGPGNAVHGVQDGRVFFKKADGAGALATVSTLVHDARRLCPPK